MWDNDSSIEDDGQETPLKYFTLPVLTQPVDAVGVIGGQAVFTAAFGVIDPGSTVYQWQIRTDGVTWGNLVETAGYYEGVATTTLTVKAIDNLLAAWDKSFNLQFRCVAIYRSLPSFTLGARLNIPVYASFVEAAFPPFYTATAEVGGSGLSRSIPAWTAVGFSTSSWVWARVSGSTEFACVSPTAPFTNFTFSPTVPGVQISYWTVTMSNGILTVSSDPLPLVGIGLSTPVSLLNPPLLSNPASSLAGAAIDGTASGAFVGPWAISVQQNLRMASAAAVTLTSAATSSTAFTRNSTNVPGTAQIVSCYAPVTRAGLPQSLVGQTVWQEPLAL